jgi:hypothetical protein
METKLIQAGTPKVRPNQELIEGLKAILAKAQLGEITDGVFIGRGYTDPGGQEPWLHHYSIERGEDMVLFIGELDVFKDVLKASVHNTRNRAAAISRVKSIGGLS